MRPATLPGTARRRRGACRADSAPAASSPGLAPRQANRPDPDRTFGHTYSPSLSRSAKDRETPAMAAKKQLVDTRVSHLLANLWDLGATDLILTVGAPPLMRRDGDLQPFNGDGPLSAADTVSILDSILKSVGREPFGDDQRELDFSFTYEDKARIRGNAYRQRCNVAVALRLIPHEIPAFQWVGVPEAVQEWANLRRGLVFVTGPTGGGKSTTLASLIDWINRNRRVHIITVEDPIEYVHNHALSAVDQREVGDDTDSFSDALRNALREDPDVLLVGEMRDLESIRFALTVAETGHLVFATLHTNDTAQSIGRMIDVFPAEQQAQIRVQLASALSCVVYQRLVPKIGGGMVAAYEVLVATPAVRNLIKEGKTHQLRNALVTGARDGMVTFEQTLST